MKKSWFVWLQTALVCSTLLLTGCENGNLFGKLTDTGDSGDPKILVSEGQDALREGNYSEALNLFEKALAVDPDNAKALYGAATAAMAGSGISLGALVSNLTSQSVSSTGVTDLSSLVRRSRISVSAAYDAPGSILDGVDVEALNAVIDTVICRLQKIVSGDTDGSINENNVDVLVNLASICVIRAILRPIRANFLDINNSNGTWTLNEGLGNFDDAFCNANQSLITLMARDFVATYQLFLRAANVLGLSDDKLIAELRDEIHDIASQLLTPAGPNNLPDACITNLGALAQDPIDINTFDDLTNVFAVMPGSC